MAPIYTNNTNHTNDTDDTHHTDNPTTIGRETSPSSFFLRNKNSLQTIKNSVERTMPHDRSRPSNYSRSPLLDHRNPLNSFLDHRYPPHSFPTPYSHNTTTRSTRSPLLIPPVRNVNVMSIRHHFAPAKPIDVFWMVRQNDLNLRAKTMNGMRKQS